MNPLRELSDMIRDYGLGGRYFLLTGFLATALMLVLYFWGREDEPPVPPPSAATTAPPPIQPGY